MSELCAEKVREILRYDPETGLLYWKSDGYRRAKVRAGEIAGCQDGRYWRVGIFGKRLRAHRVIWLIVYGRWPKGVDHVNGNGLDNRIVNLREADQSDNAKNAKMPINNTSGIVGVYWDRQKRKWNPKIGVNGKSVSLGYFDSKTDAARERKRAEKKFGFHANHGRQV